jgi:hypothetical protein
VCLKYNEAHKSQECTQNKYACKAITGSLLLTSVSAPSSTRQRKLLFWFPASLEVTWSFLWTQALPGNTWSLDWVVSTQECPKSQGDSDVPQGLRRTPLQPSLSPCRAAGETPVLLEFTAQRVLPGLSGHFRVMAIGSQGRHSVCLNPSTAHWGRWVLPSWISQRVEGDLGQDLEGIDRYKWRCW